MVAIQIRDVPEATRRALAGEAARRGQSLQFYLAGVLEREAAAANNLAWLREVASRPRVPRGADVAELIRTSHEERDRAVIETVEPGDASGSPRS